jgi:hypothetical protein
VCVRIKEIYIGKAVFKMGAFFVVIHLNNLFWGHFNVEVGLNPKVCTTECGQCETL